MKNHTDELQRILQDLDTVCQEAQQMSDASSETLVSVGCRLSAVVKRASDALESVKQALRAEALKQSKGALKTIQFDSPDGSRCMVITLPSSVQIRKDVDMEGLKAVLGETFDVLFEEVRNFMARKDFLTEVTKVDSPEKKKALTEAVDLTEGKPKVDFKG